MTVGAIALAVLAVLARAALRPHAQSTASRDVDVYRDQLAEVERDLARGVVDAPEAERLRTEIARRILATDSSPAHTPSQTSPASAKMVLVVLAFILVAGSVLLYRHLGAPGYGDMSLKDRIAFAEELRKNRPDQASAVASLPAGQAPVELAEDYAVLLQKLREAVAARPDDLNGHQLLAQNEAKIGDFVAAARAQDDVVRIRGADASVADLVQQGEFYVLAAGGYVSPEAEMVLRTALARDAENPRALYYLGLMLVQTGRPDLGFRIWDRLLRNGPEDAPWIDPIRAQIMPVARLAGVDYEMPVPGTDQPRGPSAADVEAAGDMTPQERMEMIGGMVSNLSERLASEGGPPADWARLITALGVLGETERAAAIYANALEVFADNAAALDMINRAGEQAGVAG